MKAQINNEGKLAFLVHQDNDGFFVTIFDEYDLTVSIEYDDLDYAVKNAGPFLTPQKASGFAIQLINTGQAEHHPLVPTNWQEIIEADDEYQSNRHLTADDYFGAMRP